MTPEQYNSERLGGAVPLVDLTALIKLAQKSLGVMPDGFIGPVTLAALHPAPQDQDIGVHNGWLQKVVQTEADSSWYGGGLRTPKNRPLGIVVHTTDTGPGTARNMASRRQKDFKSDPDNRLASWHITIDTDGTIVQMISAEKCAWHGGSPSARQIPGVGWANYTTVGIELVSLDDKNFPAAQIESAKKVWRALVREYRIPREHAMVSHASFEDPNRRVDPGPEWMGTHAKTVLDYAFA